MIFVDKSGESWVTHQNVLNPISGSQGQTVHQHEFVTWITTAIV